ncbi:MFS transporter [Streptomyces sp. NPDC051172]|uniref:terpene synthase family protein n=1 Tax=Streptomyces sp. NPDC051172 TaxID=3155796 RepID=UPI0034209FDA
MGLKRTLIDVTPLRSSPPFRRLWLGQTLSGFGGQMTLVAVMFQVWQMTRSPAWTGAVGLAQAIPLVALGLFAASLVDRVDRRKFYLLTTSGQAVCSLLLALQGFLGHYWSRRTVPALSDYQQLRESTVFMRAGCFVLNEIATTCPLPAAVWATPEIQFVSRTAARIVGYINDILSGPRELARPGALNLINCIAQERHCPLPAALEAAVDLHKEETAAFLHQADQVIRRHDDVPTRTCIDGLRTWIRGNLDWSLATDRYAVIKAPTVLADRREKR